MCLEIKMSSKHIVIVVDLSILECMMMMMMMMNWNRMRELFCSLSLTHLQTQSNTKELWRISFNHNHHHHYYHWWWWMKKWTANKRREKKFQINAWTNHQMTMMMMMMMKIYWLKIYFHTNNPLHVIFVCLFFLLFLIVFGMCVNFIIPEFSEFFRIVLFFRSSIQRKQF